MDAPKEQEVRPKEEIIKIGQEFQLFAPERTRTINPFSRSNELNSFSTVLLNLQEDLPKLTFQIASSRESFDPDSTMTPMDPSEGYQISHDDFDAQKRRVPEFKNQTNSKAPNLLSVEARGYKPIPGLTEMERNYLFAYPFTDKALELLDKLRLQLFFPGSPPEIQADSPDFRPPVNLESIPFDAGISHGNVTFTHFYPLDSGPLAVKSVFHDKGLWLHVPNDPQKLSVIRGKFVMAGEGEPERKIEPETDIPDKFKWK